MINLGLFFQRYRNKYGKLTQSKVEGLEFLLIKMFESKLITLKSEMADILGEVAHETDFTFQPIVERGGYTYFKYLIGRLEIENLAEANRYKGRGYIMITGKTNYRKFGNKLGIDLLGNPELACEKETAWRILEEGMTDDLLTFGDVNFTGKTLNNYFGNGKMDFYNARSIINGDKAKNGRMIADYKEAFFEMIEFE